MKKTEIKNVAIVGLGYVGLPLAILADKRGFTTFGIDIDTRKVEEINAKRSPFNDEELARDLSVSGLTATNDFSIVKDMDVIVVCVPTPVDEHHMSDLTPVIKTCESIAPFLKKGQLVVLESTVNPGVCDEIVLPTLAKLSPLKAGEDFYLAHCPERINPGDTKWRVANIPRVVGSMEENGLSIALDFYRTLITEAEIKPMASLKEAEAVKIVENSFRDINIAFVNELAMSFHSLGIDVLKVIEGASTKPFAFMPHLPGCGVGGHCIPVDPYYLIEYAKKNGFNHEFLTLARKINNSMPKFSVDLLVAKLKEKDIALKGTKIAVLGLAYKPDVGDDRESPAYEIVEHARELGLEVAAYDPYVPHEGKNDLEETMKDAKGVIIATAHKEFKTLTPGVFARHGIQVVIDGRNCLNKESFIASGVVYQGIGR